MTRGEQFDTIGFDADDTLWRSEDYFTVAEQFFVAKPWPRTRRTGSTCSTPCTPPSSTTCPISGYGVKAYGLSMVQAAVTATGGRVPSSVIGELVDHAHEMLMHPVELLDGRARDAGRGRSHAPTGADHQGRSRASAAQGAHLRPRPPLRAHPSRAREGRRHLRANCSTSGASTHALPDGRQLGQVRHAPDPRARRPGRARPVPRDVGARAGARARRRASPSWRRSASWSTGWTADRTTDPSQLAAAGPRSRGDRCPCAGSGSPARASARCSRAGCDR